MKYIEGSKYQLTDDEVCQTELKGFYVNTSEYFLDIDGTLIVKRGFAWDGCSGSIDTDTNMRASLFHDVGCLMVARGELPREALGYINRLFREHCREDGMWSARAWWHFKAITTHFANGRNPDRREVIELINGRQVQGG